MRDLNPVQWAILPFKRYFDFSGRSPRAEYWWYALFSGIAGLLLGLVDVLIMGGPVFGNYGPLGLLFTAICLVPGLAVLVRRLHDTDRTGLWSLVKLVSYGLIFAGGSPAAAMQMLQGLPTPVTIVVGLGWLAAAFAVFLFTITEGEGMPNQYGPDPYGEDQLHEVFA